MRRHVQQIVDHLYGPLGSVLLHIVLVVLLINFVVIDRRGKMPEVEVMIMDPTSINLEDMKILEQELKDLAPPEMNIEVFNDQVVPDPQMQNLNDMNMDMDLSALDVTDIASPLVMRGLYSGRSDSGRAGKLRMYGGSAATERAVLKALDWLKRNQQADGSWKEDRVAMTGLALLAFLAHGETPSSQKYGPTVEKAIKFLVNRQHDNGFFGSWPPKANGDVYAHAIATYALSEAYGLTRVPMIKTSMEAGIERIIQGQQDEGGWNYKYEKGNRRDTSVSGWHVQALKAAYLAGAENRNLKRAMGRAAQDMKRSFRQQSGGFTYAGTSEGSAAMSGVAILSLQFLNQSNGPEVQQGLRALDKLQGVWKDHNMTAPFYGWYYITQAKFHRGGMDWQRWNSQFAKTLVHNQAKDGHWPLPPKKGGGHEHGHNQGPVYGTALGALMLQVYYRNLPTFQAQAAKEFELDLYAPMEEIHIDIL